MTSDRPLAGAEALLIRRVLGGEAVSLDGLAADLRPIMTAVLAANGTGRRAKLAALDGELLAAVDAYSVRPGAVAVRPSFPVELLPDAVRLLVDEVSAATATPPDFAALPALAALCSAIGNRIRLQIKEGWTEYPVLWFCVVADASTGKSPAQSAALAPLRRVRRESDDRYREVHSEYERLLRGWESQPASSRGERPPEPVHERWYGRDATFESLRDVLATSPGIVLIQDEIRTWIGGFDRYRGGAGADRAHWLGMWSGDDVTVDRRGTGYVQIDDPVVAVVGGIQPDVLPELAGEAQKADGFIERFLYTVIETEPAPITRAVVRAATSIAFENLLRRLRRPGAERGTVQTTDAAWEAFQRWYDANNVAQRSYRGALRSLYGKLPRQLLRLALLLHCATYPDDPAGEPLDVWEITAAAELSRYFSWHGHAALRLIGVEVAAVRAAAAEPLPDVEDGLAARVRRALQRLHADGSDWISQRELGHAIRLSAAERQAARDYLQSTGELRVDLRRTGPGAGRPAECWQLTRAGGLEPDAVGGPV